MVESEREAGVGTTRIVVQHDDFPVAVPLLDPSSTLYVSLNGSGR